MSDLARITFTLRGRFYSVETWADTFYAFERRKRSGTKYHDELQGSPRLAAMLREHGVNHICEAAGMTALERDAVLLRAGGFSWGEIAERFEQSKGAVRSYYRRGLPKLQHTYRTLPMEGLSHGA